MHATNEVKHGLSDAAETLQRIDEVLRLSRSAVWEVDLDGTFTYVSASFEDLLGYRPEELVGRRTIHDFYAPDAPEDLLALLSPEWIANGEEFTEMALPLLAKSGEIVWVSSSGTPIRDAEGRITGSRGVDTDITALKKAEENVRASERALWRQIQEAPLPMAFTVLEDSDALHVNRAFVRTFGYEPEEVATIAAWFAKAYPDEARRQQAQQDTQAWMAQAARGEVLAPREYRVTCKDGRVLDVEVAAALVAGRFLGTFTDVTLRRRELELRTLREEELRRVLDNLPFPVATSTAGHDFDWQDPRAEVTYVNRRFTELFGFTREEIPTISAWAVRAFPDEVKRRAVFAILEQQVQAALRGEGVVGPVEVSIAGRGGDMREVLIQAVAAGNQLVISLEDTTERNRAERLLRERQEQLARVGRVSTLGQLAAALAHELDQPLGAILNNAEAARLLLEGEAPDVRELRAIVEDILADDRRAGEVLDRIRGMVRQRAFEPQAVPVETLLQEVARLVRPLVVSRRIALQVSGEPGLPAIAGDPVLLQQALLNLALNAVEAIGNREDGRMELRAGEPRTGWVEIGLSDNGGGVSPAEFVSLFEPFYTTKRDGLGMGLPLVHSIAEQHGGQVRLDNQPGRGLAVYLQLPVRLA